MAHIAKMVHLRRCAFARPCGILLPRCGRHGVDIDRGRRRVPVDALVNRDWIRDVDVAATNGSTGTEMAERIARRMMFAPGGGHNFEREGTSPQVGKSRIEGYWRRVESILSGTRNEISCETRRSTASSRDVKNVPNGRMVGPLATFSALSREIE
jgi:hypothetical protein